MPNNPLGVFQAEITDTIFVPTITVLPPSVSWKDYSRSIEVQGQINSCTANACVSACEMFLRANGQFQHLSRLFCYFEGRDQQDGVYNNVGSIIGTADDDLGAYIRLVISAVKNLGLPYEYLWPYSSAAINVVPSAEAYADAANRTIDSYERIDDGVIWIYDENGLWEYAVWGSSDHFLQEDEQYRNHIKSALVEGYPVIIGYWLTEAFMTLSGTLAEQANNPYQSSSANNPRLDVGHALTIVGYDDDYQAFIVENSWGESWGDEGYFLLPYNAFNDVTEAWVIKGFAGLSLTDTLPPVENPDVLPEYLPSFIPTVSTDPIFYFSGVPIMAIVANDLTWRKSVSISDTTPLGNGGKMNFATAAIVSDTYGGATNLLPNVSQLQRVIGHTTRRKMFLHVNPAPVGGAEPDQLLSTAINFATVTTGGDFCVFHEGTDTDTETDMITANARPYGACKFNAALSTGATSIVLAPEAGFLDWYNDDTVNNTPYRVGDSVYLYNTSTGFSEVLIIDTVTYGVSTITIVPTTPVVNNYTTSHVCASQLVRGAEAPVVATADTITNDSVAGFFCAGVTGLIPNNMVELNNRGCADQTWTLTFTDATHYTITGAATVTGTATSGDLTTLTNTDVSAKYLIIKGSAAFTGTFSTGDVVTFKTHSASVPIWMTRIVPAGCASLSGDQVSMYVNGESY